MKTLTNYLKTLVMIVFSTTILTLTLCSDPAACNYMAANENDPCVYVVTQDSSQFH